MIAQDLLFESDIFFQESVFSYHGKKLGELGPHVFALAESAYKSLQSDRINQVG
jgi:myosin heavy subunit